MFDVNEMPERFRSKVHISEDGCWLWTAAKFGTGYGAYRVAGKTCYAHRVAFEKYKGRIREGTEIDHLCRIRHCVNPDHLEAVAHLINVQRGNAGWRASIGACPAGHSYEEFGFVDASGYRRCIICRRETSREWARRNRAQRSS